MMGEPSKQSKESVISYIIQTQEEELKRISYELHESVGQTLYSFYTGLQFIQSGITDNHMKCFAGEMVQSLERSIKEIQMVSVELHPPTLSTLGIYPALKSYAKQYTATFGIEVEIEEGGEEKKLPEEQNVTLFRVCQEALHNAAKYADTSFIKIIFTWAENCLKIEVKDYGKGFQIDEAQTQSFPGIQAMKERMHLAGGECIISSCVGEGTEVTMVLPLMNP
ncbi:sensor histidine kinase [Fictibacillus enclensis]|nr:sensor histidine kinase [Fictibacillus enclensis]